MRRRWSVAGRPWAITQSFAHWGSLVVDHLRIDDPFFWAYWSDPTRVDLLHRPLDPRCDDADERLAHSRRLPSPPVSRDASAPAGPICPAAAGGRGSFVLASCLGYGARHGTGGC